MQHHRQSSGLFYEDHMNAFAKWYLILSNVVLCDT